MISQVELISAITKHLERQGVLQKHMPKDQALQVAEEVVVELGL